eukprot:1161142-Pelagomonas_calceolata.AAC.4
MIHRKQELAGEWPSLTTHSISKFQIVICSGRLAAVGWMANGRILHRDVAPKLQCLMNKHRQRRTGPFKAVLHILAVLHTLSYHPHLSSSSAHARSAANTSTSPGGAAHTRSVKR